MSRYFNEALYADDFDDFIAHHGILGMKWGIRRYQNADGSLTSAGKRRYWSNSNVNDINSFVKKKSKNRITRAETSYKINKKEKRKIVNRGSATEVSLHLNELTNEQKQRAINRLNLDSQIMNLSEKERSRQKSKIDKFLDVSKKVSIGVGSIAGIAMSLQKIHKVIGDSDLNLDSILNKSKSEKYVNKAVRILDHSRRLPDKSMG